MIDRAEVVSHKIKGRRKKKAMVDRKVGSRWTPALAELGWTPICDAFLENYHRLRMSHSEAMIVVHLMKFKWDTKAPYPGLKLLATQMGITEGSVRRHVQSLETKGLIERVARIGRSNRYDLSPLFVKLEELLTQDAKVRVRQKIEQLDKVIYR